MTSCIQRAFRIIPTLSFAFWLAASPSAIVAQAPVVVPNANAAVAGNSDNRFPFLVTGGMRYQQVFDASEFSSLGGPQFINQLSLRNGPFVATAFTANIASIQISLSTIATAPDNLSTTFAGNIGANNTQVYNGSLTLSSTNGAGPGNTHVFDVVINFQTPFLYDPSAGNLLLDVQNNSGADAAVGVNFFDAQFTASDSISRVFGPEGNSSATTGTADSNGLIMQFSFAAVPEPTTWALIGVVTLGTGAYTWKKRRQAIKNRFAKVK